MGEEICPVMKTLGYKNGCDIQKYRALLPADTPCNKDGLCCREYILALKEAIGINGAENLPPDRGEALRQVLATSQAA